MLSTPLTSWNNFIHNDGFLSKLKLSPSNRKLPLDQETQPRNNAKILYRHKAQARRNFHKPQPPNNEPRPCFFEKPPERTLTRSFACGCQLKITSNYVPIEYDSTIVSWLGNCNDCIAEAVLDKIKQCITFSPSTLDDSMKLGWFFGVIREAIVALSRHRAILIHDTQRKVMDRENLQFWDRLLAKDRNDMVIIHSYAILALWNGHTCQCRGMWWNFAQRRLCLMRSVRNKLQERNLFAGRPNVQYSTGRLYRTVRCTLTSKREFWGFSQRR